MSLDVPSRKDENGALPCTLRVVHLRDSPRLTALSYVWGSPPTPSGPKLRCNGIYEILITTSYRDVLSSLRPKSGVLTIWVDAVCINQSDDVENASQILHMEEIYTWATSVFIWLGKGSEATRTTMTYLERQAERYPLPPGSPCWLRLEVSGERPCLEGIVQAIRKRKAGVAKDRVCATQGVLRRLGLELPEPDYAKPDTQVLHEAFAALLRWEPTLINMLLDVGPGPSDTPTWPTFSALGSTINRYRETAGKRGLFCSRDGAIGSGPEDAGAGDRIAALKGVALPVILRPQGEGGSETFRILGPAFVCGLINGTRDAKLEKKLDWQKITLV
ncbi:heterokaryon incompatibility protein-domain-containing protein [Xylariomycetidae sp. FL0641]|nr:heterokaryon incompatibility protein-domain-containing protein [Xylariomycetidae sp. FL0641]